MPFTAVVGRRPALATIDIPYRILEDFETLLRAFKSRKIASVMDEQQARASIRSLSNFNCYGNIYRKPILGNLARTELLIRKVSSEETANFETQSNLEENWKDEVTNFEFYKF